MIFTKLDDLPCQFQFFQNRIAAEFVFGFFLIIKPIYMQNKNYTTKTTKGNRTLGKI